VGLFENPYLDAEASTQTVGKPEYMKAGYDAQLKSIVLLKNRGKVLPLQKGRTVYIPKRFTPAGRDWFGNTTPEKLEFPVNMDLVKKYLNVTEDPSKADVALVFVKGPNGGVGYDQQDKEKGGNGYVLSVCSIDHIQQKMPGARVLQRVILWWIPLILTVLIKAKLLLLQTVLT
jgi:beta-glucosidase